MSIIVRLTGLMILAIGHSHHGKCQAAPGPECRVVRVIVAARRIATQTHRCPTYRRLRRMPITNGREADSHQCVSESNWSAIERLKALKSRSESPNTSSAINQYLVRHHNQHRPVRPQGRPPHRIFRFLNLTSMHYPTSACTFCPCRQSHQESFMPPRSGLPIIVAPVTIVIIGY